ncbi:kelch-like protein diablo [Rhagoletis pomonella]|uniref:kelch-like protein diablo n=1 Tax=Rhagoletis pomonella TaxID=28610 RepID=UPI001782068F|nr:kelch-like protein diablo [Rhagoletis pomonella]
MGDPMLPGAAGSTGASTGAIDRPPSPARLSHTSEKHPKVTLSELNMLRRHRELCDVVLNVGGRKIFAHRVILSACSPYFRAMFTGELEESRQTEVTIRDIDENAMELLIDFCYTAHIIVEESNVQTLLPAACLLQLVEIQDICCEFLKRQLDPTNCLGIRAFADTHSCRELLRIADKFTQHNFQEVMESEEFLLLPVGQLVDIICSDELNVRSEEQVFNAVMSWLKYNVADRRQHLAQVLQHVRLKYQIPQPAGAFDLMEVVGVVVIVITVVELSVVLVSLVVLLECVLVVDAGINEVHVRHEEFVLVNWTVEWVTEGPVVNVACAGTNASRVGCIEVVGLLNGRLVWRNVEQQLHWETTGPTLSQEKTVWVATVWFANVQRQCIFAIEGSHYVAVQFCVGGIVVEFLGSVDEFAVEEVLWEDFVDGGQDETLEVIAVDDGQSKSVNEHAFVDMDASPSNILLEGFPILGVVEVVEESVGLFVKYQIPQPAGAFDLIEVFGVVVIVIVVVELSVVLVSLVVLLECVLVVDAGINEVHVRHEEFVLVNWTVEWVTEGPVVNVACAGTNASRVGCIEVVGLLNGRLVWRNVEQQLHWETTCPSLSQEKTVWVATVWFANVQRQCIFAIEGSHYVAVQFSVGAVLGGYLYAIGGSDGQCPLNTVERYDPRQNKWCAVNPMSTRRKHLGCAVFNNYIYAVGGRDDCMELSSAERYNPHTNTWSPIVAMTSRRSGVGLAVVNGQLYAVGGFDGSAYLKTIEVYDPETNQWRLCGCMNYRRLGGGVGVMRAPQTENYMWIRKDSVV